MARIIFMGTPDFAATILKGLLETEHEIIAVVTQPDRPVGRKRVLTASAVKEVALANDLKIYQAEKIGQSDDLKALIELEADLIITAAYGQFLPQSLLDSARIAAINVHASLLPKYRGGAPIHYAIWQGEEETGISIIYMTKKMDAGDIIAQQSLPILKTDDVGILFLKLADVGRDLLIETLPKLITNRIKPQAQEAAKVTFSPTIKKEEEELNWAQSAAEIDCHIRAFRPFPSTFTYFKGQRMKIWDGYPIELSDMQAGQAGEIVAIQPNQIIVQCGHDTYYAITEWQLHGKRRMTIKDSYNGLNPTDWLHQAFEVKGH